MNNNTQTVTTDTLGKFANQILELQAELSDCRTKFAAEIRENSELRREVAYWKSLGRADLRRAETES